MTNKALSLALAALLVANSMTASLAQAGPLGTMNKVAGPASPVLNALTDEEDESGREAAFTAGVTAALTAGTVGVATGSAAAAGAGSLAGYAGAASAVSSLGLGGVTTAVAGAMGSSATGAAATTLVVSAVGGPVVFAGLLAGGTAAAAYGVYKGVRYVMK